MSNANETALRAAILRASEVLDPQHQGDQWPDPIAWDGRPLMKQAEDLLSLLHDRATDTQPLTGLSRRYAEIVTVQRELIAAMDAAKGGAR